MNTDFEKLKGIRPFIFEVPVTSIPLVQKLNIEKAMDHGLLIYTSSAGSGKTFTLVGHYLSLILRKPENFKNILGITFTNKATGEMKSRIIAELNAMANSEKTDLWKVLIENPALKNLDLQKQASKALSLLLHDYSNFAISTIDSFFYRVLRSMARELDLPPHHEIDLDEPGFVNAAIDKLFQNLGEQNDLRQWLSEIAFSRMEADKGWYIEKDLNSFAEHILKNSDLYAHKHPPPGEWRKFLLNLKKEQDEIQKKLETFYRIQLKVFDDSGFDENNFYQKGKGPAAALAKMVRDPGNYFPNSYVQHVLENPQKWFSEKNKSAGLAEAAGRLHENLTAAIEYLNLNRQRFATGSEILRTRFIYGLTADLLQKIKETRSEKKALLIQDITQLLTKMISGNDAPFVFEKTGSHFSHFLIDEFQDTSNDHWRNLLPLAVNALAEGGSGLIVGDTKQSIYRFNGGNPELLLHGVEKDLESFSSILSRRVLSHNYRSAKHLVEFNNLFFRKIRDFLIQHHDLPVGGLLAEAFKDENLTQKLPDGADPGGLVRFEFFPRKSTVKEDGETEEESENWKHLAREQTYKTILELLDQGFKEGDIALLVRTNKEGSELITFLLGKGFTKVVSPDSMLLRNASHIRFLVDMLRYIQNPDNPVSRASALHKWSILCNDENTDMAFNRAIRKKDLFRDGMLVDEVAGQSWVKKLPLYSLVEYLIRTFGLNTRPDAFTERLLELVSDISGTEGHGLTNFLDWWNENESKEKCSIRSGEQTESVRIMTIHKSKGLQFPVVILPYLNWKFDRTHGMDILWFQTNEPGLKQFSPFPLIKSKSLIHTVFKDEYIQEMNLRLLDNLNLLYVAFTRAESRLFAFGKAMDHKKEEVGSWVSSTLELMEPSFKGDNPVFESGNSVIVSKPKSRSTHKNLVPEHFFSENWQEKISVASKGLQKLSFLPFSSGIALSPREYGLLIHDLLRQVKTKDDIHKVIAISEFEGKVRRFEREKVFKILTTIATNPQFSVLFDAGYEAHNEREIMKPDGSFERPDRVLIKGHEAIVADYKTGEPEESHREQVLGYKKLLLEMGYSPVRAFLLYIKGEGIGHQLMEIQP